MNEQVALPPHRTIITLAISVAQSRSLHVIAELGVADAIGPDEEVDIVNVASRLGCDPDALHRVLRLLEPHGIFASHGRLWSHTAASELLRSDHPASMRPFARMMGLPLNWDCFTALQHCVQTGSPAPFLGEAGGFFGYIGAHPDQLAVFDQAMTAKSHADIVALLDAVDFERFRTIADVGGGRAHLLRAVLDRHPHMSGTLFELPQVAAQVQPSADGRLSVQAGDFFVGGLPAVDLTVLMQVIHDWADTEAHKILSAVAAANASGSTLMLVDLVLPEHSDADSAKVLDVIMLAVTGGRERTGPELTALLDDAGYDLVEIHPTNGPLSAIEARRR